MSNEEHPSIPLEAKTELDSSYKITSYLQKIKMMEEKQIPQKPIEETIAHFFSKENKIIPDKVKESISKIIYSEKDRIIIAGSGSNFADQEPRDLIVLFTNSTVTAKIGGGIKYQGLDGLKYLKPGMEISINGEENIRGKIEFRARYINII